jgi:hypothetical protein
MGKLLLTCYRVELSEGGNGDDERGITGDVGGDRDRVG